MGTELLLAAAEMDWFGIAYCAILLLWIGWIYWVLFRKD